MIDKLAQSGILFTDFYFANPLCSPSRAARCDPAKKFGSTGIPGPFGWLRGGKKKDDGSIYECKCKSENDCSSNDGCGNDIFPDKWYDPNRDLTQREVMKAIIGYGLQYTDPGRFGSEEDCKENYKRCRYNRKDQSLLQNAYEHATGESTHPRFDDRYNGGYKAPDVLYSNIATVNAIEKDGKTCAEMP